MGRKKKKDARPYCWYCGPDKFFDDETVLIQHQRSKHFKCSICHRKMQTASSLKSHCLYVHKEDLPTIPNAKPGRDSFDNDIVGMQGVQELEEIEHWEEPSQKRSRFEPATDGTPPPPPPTSTQANLPPFSACLLI
jgi:hypothetical protein